MNKMMIANYYKTIVIILSLFFLPSFVNVVMQTDSLALGLLISLVILMILVNKSTFPNIKNKFFYFFFLLFLLHYFVVLFSIPSAMTEKHLLSLFIIMLMILSAAFFSLNIKKLLDKKLINLIKILSIVMIFLGLLSQVITINFSNYALYSKAIFPFSEPSHYVLVAGGVLLSSGFYISSIYRVILIVLLLFLSIIFPSTLLLFLVVLMILTYYSGNVKIIFSLLILLTLVIFYITNNLESFSYFFERLDVSSDNQNLTKLVYMQGWDFITRSLVMTNGVGLGFQNLEFLPPSHLSHLIYSLSGHYKNNSDGGFLAAKIISEFGVLGLLLIIYYLLNFYKSIVFLRRAINNNLRKLMPSWLILSHSIIVVFFLEMFVRGYGYFSPGVFFIFLSAFMIMQNKFIQKEFR